ILIALILTQEKFTVNKYGKFFYVFFAFLNGIILYNKSYTVNRIIIENILVIFDIAHGIAYNV
ncbi:MAG: hypothetical protein II284_07380, partial [Clostridia bacterium]|nr:hypothetical protein [Clostridia bacterium]